MIIIQYHAIICGKTIYIYIPQTTELEFKKEEVRGAYKLEGQ